MKYPHYHRWDDNTYFSHDHSGGNIPHGHHGARYGLTRHQVLNLPIEERRKILEYQVNERLKNIPEEQLMKELHNLD